MLFTMNNRRLGEGFGLTVGCLLLIAAQRCEAQGNLVPNPSFELMADTCPCNIGFQGTAKPLYWEKWNQSPEYFNACVDQTCAIDTLIDVPQNGFGFQYALDGEAYVGMAAYDGNADFREYVGCQLTEPLEVGETYELSFYTNVAFGGSYWAPTLACNNMGMLFTMQPNIWTDLDQPPFSLRNYAHLHSTTVLSDTANWLLVSGGFVADSAYPYMVIGNFFSDALTDTIKLLNFNTPAYYFVDGVCVTKTGQECSFTSSLVEHDVSEPNAWPNPASDRLQVRHVSGAAWHVFDATGRLVRTGVSHGELFSIDVHDWAQGQYVLSLQDKARKHVRFVVMR